MPVSAADTEATSKELQTTLTSRGLTSLRPASHGYRSGACLLSCVSWTSGTCWNTMTWKSPLSQQLLPTQDQNEKKNLENDRSSNKTEGVRQVFEQRLVIGRTDRDRYIQGNAQCGLLLLSLPLSFPSPSPPRSGPPNPASVGERCKLPSPAGKSSSNILWGTETCPLVTV